MRTLSVCVLFWLSLLSPLVFAQQSAPPRNAPVASVAGTTWSGTDSDGDYYEYYFQLDGTLHYKSPTGFWKNATWKQDGDAIYMEMNDKYSEYEGVISGARMEGKAWNKVGHKWTWVADKK